MPISRVPKGTARTVSLMFGAQLLECVGNIIAPVEAVSQEVCEDSPTIKNFLDLPAGFLAPSKRGVSLT